MKFSGKGPNIHSALKEELTGGGEMILWLNDKAAEWPWECSHEEKECAHEPKVNDPCAACDRPLLKNQMAYLTIETNQWVCWRHIGLNEPVRAEE